jgi:hypothetical protein
MLSVQERGFEQGSGCHAGCGFCHSVWVPACAGTTLVGAR